MIIESQVGQWAQAIVSVITAIAAGAAVVIASLNHRDMAKKEQVSAVHQSVNGRLDELLVATKEAAHAQGVLSVVKPSPEKQP